MYRDAFAPPQDIRRPKPWERASVPAHAPRLQGQKIWKKAGIQIRNNTEKESILLELQSEGNGTRKKQKVWGAKENIGDAAWGSAFGSENFVQDQNIVEDTGGDDAPSKGQDGGKDDALRFIPRKRTNTDHVITPRKPLRQTYLNGQAQTLEVGSGVTLREKSNRRKMSMRSIRQSTGMKAKRTSLFSAGDGAVPSLAANTDINLYLGVIQQQGETASEATFNTESSAAGNRPSDEEAEPGQLLATQRVPGSVEMGIDSQAPSTVKDTDSPKKRKRSSICRDSRRKTKSFTLSQGITEEPSVQHNIATHGIEIHLPANQDLPNLEQEVLSTDNAARTAHGICINASAEEIQGPVQLGPINGAVEQEPPSEDRFEKSVPTQDMQPDIQSVESVDMSHQAEYPPTIAGFSSDGLGHTVVEDRIRPHPGNVEVPTIDNHVISEARKALKHEQFELAEKVAAPDFPLEKKSPTDPLPASHLVSASVEAASSQTDGEAPGSAADLEPSMQVLVEHTPTLDIITTVTEELPQLPAVDPSACEPAQALPASAPSFSYEDDDTDMLRKFLTRVKANKAAKAENLTPQRKRSLPHSPLRLPLGELDTNSSPSPLSLKPKRELDAIDPSPSPKRRKRNDAVDEGNLKTIRRSGRTRLPVKSAAPGAPSLIPVRRLGKDGDGTVTLRGSEEKELAALTRVNTRKNKGAMGPAEVLLLRAAEKRDPVLKQRLLKEMFEEKKKGKSGEKGKSVAWAEELTQFQRDKKDDKDQDVAMMGPSSEEKSAVRAGAAVRNKIALGKPINGTPGPKRRTKERA